MAVNKNPDSGRSWQLLIGAVVFGVLAAILSLIYLKLREAELRAALKRPEDQMVPVVVAKGDLPRGTIISNETVAVREIPLEYLHYEVITTDLFDTVSGRPLTQPLNAGRPVLKSYVEGEFARDFSDTVTPGRRAVTVQVDELNSSSGLLRPGNRVDLFVNLPLRVAGIQIDHFGDLMSVLDAAPAGLPTLPTVTGGAADSAALADSLAQQGDVRNTPTDAVMPVLQDVLVLATGRDTHKETQEQLMQGGMRGETTYTTLTLDVTAEQGALLKAAEDKGKLIALLRNRNDRLPVSFTGVTPFDLFKNAVKQAETAAVLAAARTVEALTVTKDGKIVTRDGIVVTDPDVVVGPDGRLMTKSGIDLSGRGLKINEKGQLVSADGRVVAAKDVMVSAQGVVMTKDGAVIGEQTFTVAKDGHLVTKDGVDLTAQGYRLNDKGELVAKDGSVVPPATIAALTARGVSASEALAMAAKGYRVNEKGELVTKDGTVVPSATVAALTSRGVSASQAIELAAKGYTVNEKGELVAKDGTVVSAEKAAALAARGYVLNEKGQVVTPDGKVVSVNDVLIAADGSVTTSNGERLVAAQGPTVNGAGVLVGPDGTAMSAEDVTFTPDGFIITKDGTVMTQTGVVLSGVKVTADGKVVTADGQELRAEDLTLNADGSVSVQGQKLAGVRGVSDPALAEAVWDMVTGSGVAGAGGAASDIDLIVGGKSKDGVAAVTKLPILE